MDNLLTVENKNANRIIRNLNPSIYRDSTYVY